MTPSVRMIAIVAVALGTVAFTAPAGSGDANAVVSSSWLSQHLKDRDVVVLHVGRTAGYAREHVANSRLVDPEASGSLESDAMMNGGSMDMSALPPQAWLHSKLQKLGVSNASHVVVVFTGDVAMATRTLFLIQYAGVERVSFLDGGLAAWKRGGFPVTGDVPTIVPGKMTGRTDPSLAVDVAWVQAHLRSPHLRLIDARAPTYYDGPPAANMGMAAGHIPGARNVPFTSLFDDAGLLLGRSALEAKFRAAGVQPGDTVIAYCHVGIQATTVLLAARAAGIPVRLYAGSFHDWSNHKLPTEGGKP